jgi:2-polyprenyl-6-methoxyphenol hydroxylase-like FAD-dependent oxidoreductase
MPPRGLLTLRALEAIGRDRPRVTTVGIDRGYASTFFEIPEQRPDWKAVLTFSSPPDDSRAAYLLPVEGNRWMVSVTEMQCETLPGDHAALLEAARGLRTRTVYDAIRKARPLGTLRRFVLRESAWRHYDTVADFPHGLIPLGDAVCRFNPIYGQGMSVAAKEAGILADLLARRARDGRGLAGVPQDYLAEIQPWIAGAWSMSAVPDLAYPQTRGERPDDLQDRLSFVAALYRLAARDAAVHRRLVEVRYLQRRADALREPDLVAKVRAEMAASAGASDPLTSIAA